MRGKGREGREGKGREVGIERNGKKGKVGNDRGLGRKGMYSKRLRG